MRYRVSLIVISVLLAYQQCSFAVGSSGFENASLSASSLARGNAVTADPQDSSTIAFNPAGLTEVGDMDVTAGTSLITTSYAYKGTDGSTADASQTVYPVPYGYASTKILDGVYVGFGSNAPFGLQSKWDSTSKFRYTGHFTELKTMSYNFSLGYKVNDRLSMGAGYTYMDGSQKQVGKYNVSHIAGAAGLPDGDFELDVEGHGEGYNLGALYKLSDTQNIGLFYRSQVNLHLKGKLSSDNLGAIAGLFTPTGTSDVTSADTDIRLPHNLTLGYSQKLTDKLNWALDLGWTGWSSYDETRITFGQSNAVLSGFSQFSRDFNDTISVNTALDYALNDATNFQLGYFFYGMAANPANYDNVIPDGDRHGFGIGFDQAFYKGRIQLMYIYELVDSENVTSVSGAGNGANVSGEYSGSVHILSLGYSGKF
jgi:long-chain fatty acid transport protein